jgi:hypothetical protein
VLVGVLILERGYEAAPDEAVSADEKNAHEAFRMMTESAVSVGCPWADGSGSGGHQTTRT